MVEGLDISVDKYPILRDLGLAGYGPIREVIQLLERNLSNGNSPKTKADFAELGISVDESGVQGSIAEYLHRLNEERLRCGDSNEERGVRRKLKPKESPFLVHYLNMTSLFRYI